MPAPRAQALGWSFHSAAGFTSHSLAPWKAAGMAWPPATPWESRTECPAPGSGLAFGEQANRWERSVGCFSDRGNVRIKFECSG